MSRQPCTNADGSPKRLYKSRSGATRAARRTNHDRLNDAPVLAYLCPGTDHFHVGHSSEGGDR